MLSGNLSSFIKKEFKTGGMMKKIIIANTAVFIVLFLFGIFTTLFKIDKIYELTVSFLSMPGSFWGLIFKPWSLITASFTHIRLGHFFWNMLMFYFISKIFISFFGEKRLLTTYVFGGMFAGFIHILSYIIFPYFADKEPASVMGASGAIYAIVGAIVFHQPQLKVKLFFIISVPFWAIGTLFLLGDLIALTKEDNVAHFAHLGGLLFGVLSVMNLHSRLNIMNILEKMIDFMMRPFDGTKRAKKPKMKVYKNTEARHLTDEEFNYQKKLKQEKVDAILDKISKNGYESLSKAEKEFLFKYSNE